MERGTRAAWLIGAFLGCGTVAASSASAAQNWAGPVTWPGSFRATQIQFPGFFDKPHTLSVRFYAQYPRAYRGALLASGDGRFYLGVGDFRGDRINRAQKLVLEVDGKRHVVPFPVGSYPAFADDWHQVTVVRRFKTPNAIFEVWVNGKHLCEVPPADACDLVMEQLYPSNIATPAGPLRVGRRFADIDEDDQFYGLVDDIALFDKDLSPSRIEKLADAHRLSGYEKNLTVAYSFDPESPLGGPRPPKLLGSPYRARGDRSRVKVSSTRKSSDSSAFPLPSRNYTRRLRVPFRKGQRWSVLQGYGASDSGSHVGYAAFSYDFVLAGKQTSGKPSNPYDPGNKTCGEPIYAADDGTLTSARDEGNFSDPEVADPTAKPNDDFDGHNQLVMIDPAGNQHKYLHLFTGSVRAEFPGQTLPGDFGPAPPYQPGAPGVPVAESKRIARVGTRNGCHLHLSISRDGVTIPVAFENFDVCFPKTDCSKEGHWFPIPYGVPPHGSQIRHRK